MSKPLIMGVDISSKSTGWALIQGDNLVEYGKINPTGKMTNAQKMNLFQVELRKIIESKQPNEIAIEDVIQVRSVSVLKLLARFNGIAIIEAYRQLQKDPTLFEPARWKTFVDGCIGSSKKCEVQLAVCRKYGLLTQEKIDAYQTRIDDASAKLKSCDGDDTKSQLKQLKKDLRQCKKKDPSNKEKLTDIENKIDEIKEQNVKSKKVGKKELSVTFDKISVDIYTETSINEDIADATGVAIAFQKTNVNES